MTARQAILNYESRVREYTNFAMRGIKKVCKECGPRETGGEAEFKAQKIMAAELEGCCDSVKTEEFRLAPRAFMAWVRICVVLGLAATAAYNLGQAWLSLALMVLLVLVLAMEFLLYKQFLDPFFRKKTSHNVVAVRKPAGEVQRRLILCGHADSAPEWRFTYYGDKWFHSTKLTIVFVGSAVVMIVLGLAAAVAAIAAGHAARPIGELALRGTALNILGYIEIAMCVPLCINWLFHNNNRFVMGANDNLTGCYTAMAVAKLLGNLNINLEHTELVVLCGGAEEAGLRGAKAFCKAHAEEYQDVETAFIALDTMTDFKYMGIYVRDMTNTVKNDPAVCALLQQGAKTAGHNVPYENLFFGSSDAAAATQAGMRATTFAAMDPAPAAYYHTRLDTVEALQSKTVEACLDIVLETVFQFDETGLAPFEGAVAKAGAKS